MCRLDRRSLHYPGNKAMRWIVKRLVDLVMPVVTRPRIEGQEHIPAGGPLLVVCNHFHVVDPVIVIGALPWPPEFLGSAEMPHTPQIARVFPALYGRHLISPGKANYGSLIAGEAVLNAGGVLCIFPEGTPQGGPLRPAQPGAALIALRTGVPVLPLGLVSEDGWDIFGVPWRERRRMSFSLRIGEVFGPLTCEDRRRPSRKALQNAQDRIISEIADLIPASFGGRIS